MSLPIKVEHINPFIAATIDTFKSMMKESVTYTKPILVKGANLQHDISGIIGLSGGARGTVTLSFPRATALKTVTSFIGEAVTEIDDTVKDAIGELANIVAGGAKKDLVQYKISISLPTIVIGDSHEVQGGRDAMALAVPFQSTMGPFSLIVSFKSED